MNLDDLRRSLDDLVAAQPAPPDPKPPARRLPGGRTAAAIVTAAVVAIAALMVPDRLPGGTSGGPRGRDGIDLELIVSRRSLTGTVALAESTRYEFRRGAESRTMRLEGRRFIDFDNDIAVGVYRDLATDDVMEERNVGGRSYYRYPQSWRTVLGIPTPWVGVATAVPQLGGLPAELSASSPAELLDQVARERPGAYESVTSLGRDDVRGVSTRHYRIHGDPERLREILVDRGVPEALMRDLTIVETIDLWVDDGNRLRRITTTTDQRHTDPSVSDVTATAVQEVISYGEPLPPVMAPPAAATVWVDIHGLAFRMSRLDPFEREHQEGNS